jgi:hypothetical protein
MPRLVRNSPKEPRISNGIRFSRGGPSFPIRVTDNFAYNFAPRFLAPSGEQGIVFSPSFYDGVSGSFSR